MKFVLIAATTLALTGCMSSEELRARDEATCREYGFKKRNDAFAECLQRIALDRRAQSRADLYEFNRGWRGPDYWAAPRYYRPRPAAVAPKPTAPAP